MSRRAIRAGRAEIYVGLNDDGLQAKFRSIETRMKATATMLKSVGTKFIAIGGGMAGALALPTRAASSFQESFSKFQVVFGKNSDAVKQWSDDFAKRIGRSKSQMVDFLGQAQDTFVPLGFDPAEAEAMSKQVTKLAIDLASFNDMSDQDAFDSLMSSMVGNTENLRKFGVVAQQTQIKVKALEMGFDASSLTAYQKAQVIMRLTMEGTTAAQGDAIRTSTEFANRMKMVKGAINDLMVTAGTPLLDVLAAIGKTITEIVESANTWAAANGELVIAIATASAGLVTFGGVLLAAGFGLQLLTTAATLAGVAMTVLKVAFIVTKAIVIASTVAWIAFQVAAWGVLAATVAATAVVKTFGVRVIAAKIATIAWTTATSAAKLAVMLATNAVTVGKAALGAYLIVTRSVAVATNLMTGRFIAAYTSLGILRVGAGLLGGALVSAGVATSAMGVAQTFAAMTSGLLNGSLLTHVVGATASIASALSIASAWSVTAVAVEAAQAAMSFGLSIGIKGAIAGIVIAAGSLAAVVAAASASITVASQEMATGWTYAKGVLVQFWNIGKQVFGGIRDALAAGQYMLAAQILWAGLKQAFWLGVKEVISIFRSLPSTVWRIIKNFAGKFISTLWKLFKAIPTMLKNALTGMSLGDSIKSILGTGDWLEGLATDKLIDARNELNALTGAAKSFRDEQSQAKAVSGQKSKINDFLGEKEAVASPAAKKKHDDREAEKQAIADKRQQLMNRRKGAEMFGDDNKVKEIDGLLAKLAEYGKDREKAHKDSAGKLPPEDTSDKVQTAAEQRIQSLKDEIMEMERGADAAELFKLARDGATEAEVEATRELLEQRRKIEAQKEARDEKAKDAVDKLSKAADQLFKETGSADLAYNFQTQDIDKQLKNGTLNDAEAKDAKKQAGDDRDTRKESRKGEADAIRDSLKTPLEKFNDKVTGIESLVTTGELTRDEGTAAIGKERKDFIANNAGTSDKRAGIAEFGSSSALETLGRTRGDGAAQAPPWVNPMTQGIQQQVAAATALPGQIAASMATATQKAIDTKRLEELSEQQLEEQKKVPTLLRTIVTNTAGTSGGDDL